MKTPLFSIGTRDLIKGFITAILTVVFTGLMTALDEGAMPNMLTIKKILIAGLGAGLAYVIKNVLTNSKDQFATPEPAPTLPNHD